MVGRKIHNSLHLTARTRTGSVMRRLIAATAILLSPALVTKNLSDTTIEIGTGMAAAFLLGVEFGRRLINPVIAPSEPASEALPTTECDAEEQITQSYQPSTGRPGISSKLSILVVDDEPSIVRAISIGLTRAGFNPTSTISGEGALYHLRTIHFDMLLVDLRIPDMRGDVLFHLACSLQPHLRSHTIMMTGDVTEQAADIIAACQCPFIMKPFDLRSLLKVVNDVAGTLPHNADSPAVQHG
jgi:CheY-like chemotaxis protein